jgi:hypothetical protein
MTQAPSIGCIGCIGPGIMGATAAGQGPSPWQRILTA